MNHTLTRMTLGLHLLALSSTLACGDKDDTGSGLPVAEAPEVAGNYQVTIGGTTGCEGEASWINDWATGPLIVEGTGGSLTFDFGDDYVFSGSIDSLGRYQFEGVITFQEAELEVKNEGQFELDPDFDGERYLVDGDFEVTVDDDEFEKNNCTITGPMQAVQLVGI
ncbi:hypothetical protein L6R53_22840 [Myxococcota bacterium]|nr:hypothetical protein [Myxococcota bacterium]